MKGPSITGFTAVRRHHAVTLCHCTLFVYSLMPPHTLGHTATSMPTPHTMPHRSRAIPYHTMPYHTKPYACFKKDVPHLSNQPYRPYHGHIKCNDQSDPDNRDSAYSDGDVLELKFDYPTTVPPAASKAQLASLFEFYQEPVRRLC